MTEKENRPMDKYFKDTIDICKRTTKEMLKSSEDVPHLNLGDTVDELEANITEFPNLDGMQNVQIPDDWDGGELEPIKTQDFIKEESNIEPVSLPYKDDKVIVNLSPEELVILRNILLRSVFDFKKDRYFVEMGYSSLDEITKYKSLSSDIKEVLDQYYKKKGYDPLLESWKKKGLSEHEV